MTSERNRRNIVVISPHFDDVPLSLGESLRGGSLSGHNVRVRTVFGRTNWTTWVHPTPSRAVVVSLWRRIEESFASVLFDYRWSAAGWEEVILRCADLDPASFLDPEVDLSDDDLVDDIAAWLMRVTDVPTDTTRRLRQWAGRPDLILVPAGLGGHRDHMVVAVAATRLTDMIHIPVGFYEDRPYRAYLDDDSVRAHLQRVVGDVEPVTVSGSVRSSTQMMARLCYPSQMTSYFRDAMDLDRRASSYETVWFPDGSAPKWLDGRTDDQ